MIHGIRVQLLGPKGGVQSHKTFHGNEQAQIVKVLESILEAKKDKPEPVAIPCQPHHDLKKGRAKKDGTRTWTCKDCHLQIVEAAERSAFFAQLMISFREGGL